MLEMEALQGEIACFPLHLYQKIEMALPVPTKLLLETSPDAAMLFAPSGAPTHLPLSRPFC